jgi:GT2 family glycosyltransferase
MIPQLSIIIVAYRSRDEIGPCLNSLPRELDGRAVEIVVVDNSPGDGAGEMVGRDFPWVRQVPAPENLGFGRANNLGFRQTSGECVLFLNPDTISNATALGHCVRRLQTELDIGLISPKLMLADGSMDLACRRSIPTLWDGFCRATGLAAAFPQAKLFGGYNLTYLPADGTYDVGAINGAFMMGRRAVLEQVAGSGMGILPMSGRSSQTTDVGDPLAGARGYSPVVFDEAFFMYGDDLDLCIRVARAGYRIVYDGRVQITHLKGVSVGKDYDRMARAIFDANRDVYLKHFNSRGSRLVAWKYRLAFGAWKLLARLRARISGYRRVKPP